MLKIHSKGAISNIIGLIGCLLSIIILTAVFGCSTLLAQANNTVTVSVNVKGVRISTLLNSLQKDYNLNLSYNAGDSAFNKIVSYEATNKPVDKVLSDLVKLSGHQYKIIDNQFVIFPSQEIPATIAPVPLLSKKTTRQPETISDTIFVDKIVQKTDTLIRIDTLIRTDTIVQYDTIIVYREPVPEKVKGKIKSVRTDVFNDDARRNEGWAFGIAYGKLLTDYKVTAISEEKELANMIDESENWSFRGNLLSMNAFYNYHRFKAGAAIDYSNITNKFTFDKVISSGGMFDVDTLDTYYTLTGIDTNWVYIKDSAWIPLDQKTYIYDQFNSLSYIDFQLSAAYAFIHNRSIEMYLQAGISMNLLVSASGSTLTKTTDYEVIDFDKLAFSKINYTSMFGIGARYKLNDAFDINPEIYYLGQLKDVYESTMVSKKMHGAGFKIGILYYL
jgi:hypothetical protein